jgi:hypothetical protein
MDEMHIRHAIAAVKSAIPTWAYLDSATKSTSQPLVR